MTFRRSDAGELQQRLLDVNMGCPVKKVTRNGAGSALMCDPARAAAIIEAMRRAVGDDVPITAKIRSGWDEDNKNAVEVGKALEGAGCAAVVNLVQNGPGSRDCTGVGCGGGYGGLYCFALEP